MKKILSIILVTSIVALCFANIALANSMDGAYFPDSERWTNINSTVATDLIENEEADDDFVFIFYKDTCSYSTSMLPLVHYYSTINNVDFYALEYNSNGPWSWLSVVPKTTITFPIVVVYNEKKGIMVGDADVHSDGELRGLIKSAKIDFNFSSEIRVKIGSKYIDFNGEQIETDVPATIIDGRTMIPVRIISELFGASVLYLGKNTTGREFVKINRGDKSICLYEGYKKMLVGAGGNELWKDIDAAPVIINGRMLIPARALAEALGFTVSWDEINKQAVFLLE